MADDPRYFIRLPVRKGTTRHFVWDYVEIDPMQLHAGLLTDTYVLDRGDSLDAKVRYLQAHGVVPEDLAANPHKVLAKLHEQAEMIRVISKGATGAAAKFYTDALKMLGHLPQIIEHTAKGHFDSAANAVEGSGYGLISLLAETAEQLVGLEA